MLKYLLRLFLSHRCFVCGTELSMHETGHCCETCAALLETSKNRETKCEKCGRPLNYMYNNPVCTSCQKFSYAFDGAASAFSYNGYGKDMVLRFKFGKQSFLAPIMAEYMLPLLSGHTFDAIVYPPINRKRFYKRGFNQAELLGEQIAELTGMPLYRNALRKIRQTEIQSRLKGKDRFRNVSGAYMVNRKFQGKLEGKKLLLVDDVLTTGATMSECAKMLKKCGAASVFVITFSAVAES